MEGTGNEGKWRRKKRESERERERELALEGARSFRGLLCCGHGVATGFNERRSQELRYRFYCF